MGNELSRAGTDVHGDQAVDAPTAQPSSQEVPVSSLSDVGSEVSQSGESHVTRHGASTGLNSLPRAPFLAIPVGAFFVIKGVLDARSTANGYAPGGEMLDVLWTNASFAALGVWLGVLGVAVAVPPTGKRIVLLRRAALVLAVLSLASLGLANLVYYQVYAGWPALVRNHAALSGLAEGVSIVLFPIVPAALLYRNPVLATNSAFRVTTNLLAALFPLVIAAGAWFREVPIWFAAVNVALTLLMVQICLSAVRRRWDAVEVLTGVFGLADRIRSGDREWLRWINQHLPDPDLQAEMVKAYMRNHPNQRARSLLGWACVTLATAAAAGAGRALVTSILRAFH